LKQLKQVRCSKIRKKSATSIGNNINGNNIIGNNINGNNIKIDVIIISSKVTCSCYDIAEKLIT
jgi:hypothetical protein